MKATSWGWLVLLLAAVLYLLSASFYELRPGQSAIILNAGRVTGEHVQPGLYLHWPFLQSVQIIDTRRRSQSTKAVTLVPKSGPALQLDCFVQWHVDDATRFYQHGLNTALAEGEVSDAVQAALRLLIEKNPDDSPNNDLLTHWQKQLFTTVSQQLQKDGIRLDDLHFLEIGLTPDAQQAVYQKMRADLQNQLTEVQLAGKTQVDDIKNAGEKARQQVLSDAYTSSQQTLGAAQAQAAKIYADSYGKDPSFYAFYRSLEILQHNAKPGDVWVLSANSPLLQYLHRGLATGGK
ncbi:SPFH domain-containing protein [Candidatus Igneacidithiobacillus taiwanensis]|uniref:SPFH domain-containing protein n=1 Tax=Candidatus Igneacidithiobacillus taiwanensis TaxID=1945924 RepID=UPI0028A27B72|nr:SPFH domain-containing protein [Candidatus Igneacidithiobacillus taiwanensis]MCE5359506.1 hypothetical protein [Acidithiobacillus sp.]